MVLLPCEPPLSGITFTDYLSVERQIKVAGSPTAKSSILMFFATSGIFNNLNSRQYGKARIIE